AMASSRVPLWFPPVRLSVKARSRWTWGIGERRHHQAASGVDLPLAASRLCAHPAVRSDHNAPSANPVGDIGDDEALWSAFGVVVHRMVHDTEEWSTGPSGTWSGTSLPRSWPGNRDRPRRR